MKHMKKTSIILFFLIFILTGCFLNKQPVDRSVKDGDYYYSNKDLGFSLILPPEFMYYQTQRKETENYIDLEIFVPTIDKTIVHEVPDYAKPITIRIFNKDYWQTVDEAADTFIKIGENGNRVYTLIFWSEVPNDWLGKWNEEVINKIKNNFKIL